MKKLLYAVAKAEYFLSHRLSLAKAAKANGYKVAVASTPFARPLPGMESFAIPFKRGGVNVFRELRVLWALFKVIKAHKPDLLHNVALKPVIYGGILARVLKIPSINSVNGFGYVFTSAHVKARLLKPLATLWLKLALNHKGAVTIAQNRDDFNECLKLFPKGDVRFVPGSGVDIAYFAPSGVIPPRPEAFVFALVARMLRSKGAFEYVAAARLVKRAYPKARFLLVGDPDPENPESISPELLSEWNASGVVEWLGHRGDVKEIYAMASVAVLPSYREGLPKSLLEAMACGLPIIATDAVGCRDLFHANGYLTPPRDADALAKAMLACATSDPKTYATMAFNGRRAVERLYADSIVNREMIAIYGELA